MFIRGAHKSRPLVCVCVCLSQLSLVFHITNTLFCFGWSVNDPCSSRVPFRFNHHSKLWDRPSSGTIRHRRLAVCSCPGLRSTSREHRRICRPFISQRLVSLLAAFHAVLQIFHCFCFLRFFPADGPALTFPARSLWPFGPSAPIF